MIKKIFTYIPANILLLVIISQVTTFAQTGEDLVEGNLIQFNNNGAWCWYQDERAIVDTEQGKLILGSDASG